MASHFRHDRGALDALHPAARDKDQTARHDRRFQLPETLPHQTSGAVARHREKRVLFSAYHPRSNLTVVRGRETDRQQRTGRLASARLDLREFTAQGQFVPFRQRETRPCGDPDGRTDCGPLRHILTGGPLRGKFHAALHPAAFQNQTAALGGHARHETDPTFSSAVRRLKCSFHHSLPLCCCFMPFRDALLRSAAARGDLRNVRRFRDSGRIAA